MSVGGLVGDVGGKTEGRDVRGRGGSLVGEKVGRLSESVVREMLEHP